MTLPWTKNRQNNIDMGKLPTIFPLSANSNLTADDMPGLNVYKCYLTKAFSESRIRNIVVTGNFGVGKSSVIRSFEKEYCKKQGNRAKHSNFLYVSLGDYITEKSPLAEKKVAQEPGEQPQEDADSPNDNNKQQNILERRLLLQIYARFHRKDLPASSFKLIQEHSRFSRDIVPLICGFMTAIILLLSFHEPIGILLNTNFCRIDTSRLQGKIGTWLNTIFSNIDVLKSWGHLILYLAAIALVTVAVFFIIRHELPKLQAKALVVKTNTLEASYESDACDSYLDQHATEIVYCLEQIADKINYTVVFEDLDWFDAGACLEIFTRLREINYLVNLRLSQKKKKHLRFIYVTNDNMISRLNHSKFFDYIMPVFPRLNEKTAEQIFVDNIKTVHDDLNCELTINLTPNGSDCLANKAIHLIAPYLSDYRLQYTVLNEYSMLIRLCFESNGNVTNINIISENILAFAVYKNLFPEDYSNIWWGKSNVFPTYDEGKFEGKDKELLNSLRCGENPLLPNRCLYYVGFRREDIVNLHMSQLKINLEETLGDTKVDNMEELCEALGKYCIELSNSISSGCTIKDSIVNNFKTAIKYMVTHRFDNWDWLFSEKMPIIFALEILSQFNKNEDDMLRDLFKLAGLDIEGQNSLFEKCKGFNDISHARDLTDREYEILRMGTGNQYNGNITLNGQKLRRHM